LIKLLYSVQFSKRINIQGGAIEERRGEEENRKTGLTDREGESRTTLFAKVREKEEKGQ
jgi:hypothetical protein